MKERNIRALPSKTASYNELRGGLLHEEEEWANTPVFGGENNGVNTGNAF